MDGLVILSRQEQEYLLHAIESSLDLAESRELFLWAQGQLQTLLPHRLLVCLQVGPAGEVLRTDLLHADAAAPPAAQAFRDPARGPLPALLERWRSGGARPLALQADDDGSLASLGVVNLLAHGSAPLAGGFTFFLLCDLPRRPDGRHAHFLRLLLPHLHLALLRLAPVGVPPQRGLSTRETQVLRWLREGKSNDEIGHILGISALTVKNHLQRLYRVLGVSNRTHAVARSTMLR
ncbi:helix-turn-helix transcriptional regulator [Pseudoduganella umbonata]|nr:helix-turn-helix transcriptional regulator [Pseudoduganella umbonata]